MLLDRQQPACLTRDDFIYLIHHSRENRLVVWLCLVLTIVSQPSKLVDVHLLVIDCHLQLRDERSMRMVLVFMPFNCILQLFDT